MKFNNNNKIFFIILLVVALVTLGLIAFIIYKFVKWILNRDSFEDKISNKLPKIVLITEYFIHKNPIRYLEMKKSIDLNDKNKYIDKIYLLNEKENDTFTSYNNSNKIINIPANKRSTFLDAFKLANTLPKGTIAIVSNNDISFDNSIKNLYDVDLSNTVICLGRRDAHNENKLEYWTKKGLSHDSWIFMVPLKIPKESDFYFGTTACDRHIAYLFEKEGYNLISIPWDIKALHHHKSEERKWNKKPTNFNGKYSVVPVIKNIYDKNNKVILNKKSLNKNSLFSKIYKILEYWT
jgi:hypothetical protein